jgi:hypothetical protein
MAGRGFFDASRKASLSPPVFEKYAWPGRRADGQTRLSSSFGGAWGVAHMAGQVFRSTMKDSGPCRSRTLW